jgi:hypothetical protein
MRISRRAAGVTALGLVVVSAPAEAREPPR